MTFMDDDHSEMPVTDDPFGPPGVDRRRIAIAAAVSLLAACAVFFVARTGLDDDSHRSRAQSASAKELTTSRAARPRPAVTPDGELPPTELGDICDDSLREFLPDAFCETDADPLSSPAASQPDPERPVGEGDVRDGWSGHRFTTGGRSGTMSAPSAWTEEYDEYGTFMLLSPDGLSGAGASAADYHGEPLDELADRYVEEVRTSYAPDLEVTDRGSATINGHDGYRLRFTATKDDVRWNAEVRFLIDGDAIWVGLWTHNDDASEPEEVPRTVLDTFEPVNAA